ncbi:MAG: histidine phosphatase family protein [Planctomycetota bacterium]
MLVYLIRHGKAKPDSPTGRDADRPLRKLGRRQAEHLAAWLEAHPTPPTTLVSSGLVRAEQTAQAILETLECTHEHDERLGDFFADDTPERLARRHAHEPALAIVGHNEHLSMSLSNWIGGAERLRTGEMAVLSIDDPDADVLDVTLLERVRLDER